MKKNVIFIALALILLFSTPLASSQEDDEPKVFGIDMDELISIGSGLLALLLFIITFVAYSRDGRKKLLYIAIAFFLFFMKGTLLTLEIFLFEDSAFIDSLANFLDFAILLSFFFGVVKK